MKTVLIVSDTHINSSVALSPRTVTLDDGGSYLSSAGQGWLWDNWQRLAERAAEIARKNELILVSNGDMVDGDCKDRTFATISKNPTAIVRMAVDAFTPLVNIASGVYIVRGTEAHVGKSANLEEMVASDLTNVKKPEDRKAYSWEMLRLDVEGVLMEFAHHARMSNIPWTKASSVDLLASKVFHAYAQAYMRYGERIPRIVVRSHMHQWGDSHDAEPLRILFTPCWKLKDSHTIKINPSGVDDFGAYFIHCDGGKYEIEKYEVKPQRRVWVVA